MAEYTYKDVIIDPTSEEAKNCIGKVVYYSDSPTECLYYANKNNTVYCGTLKEIDINTHCPFVSGINADTWACIILKKEEPKPVYVPFESANEFLLEYKKLFANSKVDTIDWNVFDFGGIYLKYNDNSGTAYLSVTEIWNSGLAIGGDASIVDWDMILENYTFLNGTPCGKLKEADNA